MQNKSTLLAKIWREIKRPFKKMLFVIYSPILLDMNNRFHEYLTHVDNLKLCIEQTNQKIDQTNRCVEQTNQKMDQTNRCVEQTSDWARIAERTSRKMMINWNNYSLLSSRNSKGLEGNQDYKWGQTIRQLLSVMKVKKYGNNYIRVGKNNDGGYVMFNDFPADSIAYSFGINDDVSWDRDIAARDIDVFMYDHTIPGLPESNSRFHFFRNGTEVIQNFCITTQPR